MLLNAHPTEILPETPRLEIVFWFINLNTYWLSGHEDVNNT